MRTTNTPHADGAEPVRGVRGTRPIGRPRRLRLLAVFALTVLGVGLTVACYPLGHIVTVVGGLDHSCALHDDGTVTCWGSYNNGGELGNGTVQGSLNPVPAIGITTATSIAAGPRNTCVVLADGTVRCWGDNTTGQLGDPGVHAGSSSTPVVVAGVAGAVSLAVGLDHSCAVLGDGTAECWGDNTYGQLGTNAGTGSFVNAAPVVGLAGVAMIAAGTDHTCAALTDGTARCWGDNTYGQLGDGTTTASTVPVAVFDLTGAGGHVRPAPAVTAGAHHSCAILTDGSMRCWGDNSKGQLGDGTTTARTVPTIVSGLTAPGFSAATSAAAGGDHTCATLDDGTGRCWGDNTNGQLGDASFTGHTTPVAVTGLAGIATIGAGSLHTCATLGDGTARCWGADRAGQLGDHALTYLPTTGRSSPVSVENPWAPGTFVQIAAGDVDTCGVLADGHISCWGDGIYGQLGNGSNAPSAFPVVVAGITTATSVAVGWNTTCATLADGTARCWGRNTYGQLGNGTTVASKLPVVVTGLSGAVSISVGQFHACATLTDGTARCWGRNNLGQLGNGTTTNSLVPVAVTGLTTATGITAGSQHTCALLAGASARCWGDNHAGQLGNGTTTTTNLPAVVTGLHATSIDAGTATTCATVGDGTARCWGDNSSGQLGDGTTTYRPTPTAVAGLTTAAGVSTASGHSCAALADGSARCWGANSDGQLGTGSTDQALTPAVVAGLTDVTTVSAGGVHSCARRPDGTLRCWGHNASGELGLGDLTVRHWAYDSVIVSR